MTNEDHEDKTSQNNDDLEGNQDAYGEDDSSTTSHGEETEGDAVTLTRAELEQREREIRKEQDRRWRERIKKASGDEDGDSRHKSGKEDRPSVDERYDRLELKTEGIKDKEQQDFVLDYAKLKGISVTEAMNAPVVRVELRQMGEEAKQRQAIPSSSNRTAQPRKDDVEYWAHQLQDKGKSAPTADMRRKVRKYLAGD